MRSPYISLIDHKQVSQIFLTSFSILNFLLLLSLSFQSVLTMPAYHSLLVCHLLKQNRLIVLAAMLCYHNALISIELPIIIPNVVPLISNTI